MQVRMRASLYESAAFAGCVTQRSAGMQSAICLMACRCARTSLIQVDTSTCCTVRDVWLYTVAHVRRHRCRVLGEELSAIAARMLQCIERGRIGAEVDSCGEWSCWVSQQCIHMSHVAYKDRSQRESCSTVSNLYCEMGAADARRSVTRCVPVSSLVLPLSVHLFTSTSRQSAAQPFDSLI